MRYVTLLLLGTLGASPALAASPQTAALEAAIRFVPAVLNGTRAAETAGLLLRDFAIAEETVACEEQFLAEWLKKAHSNAIVEELVASYHANGAQPTRLESDTTGIPILELHRFQTEGNQYDWSRLSAAHPNVRGVVRMSLPALDSQSMYAVAHYEVITPAGAAFANFEKFEKQTDGTWKPTSGVTGSLRSVVDHRGDRAVELSQ